MVFTFYTLGAPAIALGDAVTLGATSPIFIALLSPSQPSPCSAPSSRPSP
jgi:hypothetical protein